MNFSVNKKTFLKAYFSGLLLVPLVLIILPADFFDTGQSICLSVILLDQECLGCGMTRAVQHMIHFDFMEAYNFNKLSFVVFPILAIVYVKEVWRAYMNIA